MNRKNPRRKLLSYAFSIVSGLAILGNAEARVQDYWPITLAWIPMRQSRPNIF